MAVKAIILAQYGQGWGNIKIYSSYDYAFLIEESFHDSLYLMNFIVLEL